MTPARCCVCRRILIGLLQSEFAALLEQNRIYHTEEFPDEVLQDLPPQSWEIPEEEFAKRRDLRSTRIFSIDPGALPQKPPMRAYTNGSAATAKDLDDALSCEKLDNGHWRLGVHIADVTYFVKQ